MKKVTFNEPDLKDMKEDHVNDLSGLIAQAMRSRRKFLKESDNLAVSAEHQV